MSVEQVRVRIEKLRELADKGDLEAAHALEDRIHTWVLDEIACGASNASALAEEALKTRQVPFARECA